jgi:chromate transport protein ChrA
MPEHTVPELSESATLSGIWELALFFLRLGTTAFGGPAAHIAIMEDELVRRRRWLSREKFLDLLGVSNLIPGPSSSELAIHIGYLRAGWIGLLVAGTCFIFPAAIIVTVLAWFYVHFSKLPATSAILYGVKPVVIAIILQAVWGLGRTALKTKFLGLVGAFSVVLALLGLHPLLLLLVVGSVAWAEESTNIAPIFLHVRFLSWSHSGFGRYSSFVQFGFSVSSVFEIGCGCIWEWLRLAGIPSRRLGRASRLAYRLATG